MDPFSPHAAVGPRRPPSGHETVNVFVCWLGRHSGPTRSVLQWPKHGGSVKAEGRKEEKEREWRGKRAWEEREGTRGEKGEAQNWATCPVFSSSFFVLKLLFYPKLPLIPFWLRFEFLFSN